MKQKPKPQQDDERAHRVELLAENLLAKRDEAVEGRAASGIERQWREDQHAFEGLDANSGKTAMLDYATGEQFVGKATNEPRRSKVIVNIIRGKCNTAEGRFSEIMLPTDDLNFGILPSKNATLPVAAPPVAPMAQQADPMAAMPADPMAQQLPAQPVDAMAGLAPADPDAEKKQVQAEAKKRSAAMQDEIFDQLGESEFNSECRKVVRSAVRLGTGVLKGPFVVKTVRKAWIEQKDADGSVYVMESSEKMTPSSRACDIWNIYPDPNCGENPKRGAYIWERDNILPRELHDLIGVPGYNVSQIRKVLAEDPKRTIVKLEKGGAQKVQQTTVTKGAPYEKWEYHGDVGREDLEAMGVEVPEDMASFSACVVFVNDRPVKVALNLLDTGELPYDFFVWETVSDSPFGIGEPRKIMWQQRVMTGAWRAMMDNAGDSAGSQIIMSSSVEPDDGDWNFNGKKIWVVDGEDADVRSAFAQHQITNNQVELQNIIELALRFTDMESGTPMLAQGEKGSAPETLGGMQLLMQGADTTRRQQVKMWDDLVTRPHIGRYYHWNMQYSKKNEIKGDFEVDARGTSVLLIKDQAAQSLMQVFQLKQDPEVNLLVDWEKAVKQLFEARHLDVMKSEEAIKQARAALAQQPPPSAPQVQVAQINAEARKATQDAEQAYQAEIENLHQTFKAREADKDRELDLMLQQLQSSAAQGLNSDTLKVKIADFTARLKTQRDLSEASMAIGLHEGKRSPQAISPPTEPARRAPNGQSFQR